MGLHQSEPGRYARLALAHQREVSRNVADRHVRGAQAVHEHHPSQRRIVIDPPAAGIATNLDQPDPLVVAQGMRADPGGLRNLADRQFGSDHPAVGTRINNLALLYREQARYAEADVRFRRALEIADRAYVVETGRILLSGTGPSLRRNPEVQKAYLGG